MAAKLIVPLPVKIRVKERDRDRKIVVGQRRKKIGKILKFLETFLIFEGFRLLPVEFRATKMSVARGALENWAVQVQILDNFSWSEIKVLVDNLSQFLLALG